MHLQVSARELPLSFAEMICFSTVSQGIWLEFERQQLYLHCLKCRRPAWTSAFVSTLFSFLFVWFAHSGPGSSCDTHFSKSYRRRRQESPVQQLCVSQVVFFMACRLERFVACCSSISRGNKKTPDIRPQSEPFVRRCGTWIVSMEPALCDIDSFYNLHLAMWWNWKVQRRANYLWSYLSKCPTQWLSPFRTLRMETLPGECGSFFKKKRGTFFKKYTGTTVYSFLP